ncbi:4-alpha-glucanotransferase [Simkania negevensis]|uniref:4-alpha-glucanotransferase n=1 Tax=Simkania negevensis TaxID=83561 RepID=A0ABS3AQD5_9BACT|nr:4-alpha-glucanotransferase [Simkania negevensis]
MDLKETLQQSAAWRQWEDVAIKNHHGIVIPLFAIHSKNSCGIGEYLDLIPLIDWCKSVGMDIIQLLPLNDTGMDKSPYNALSAYALNPIHITIHAIKGIETTPGYHELFSQLQQLNKRSHIDYRKVREYKTRLLKAYYHRHHNSITKTAGYQQFLAKNSWATNYALFKTLKEINSWQHWECWPQAMKTPSEQEYKQLLDEHKDPVRFHLFVQYCCYNQLKKVKEYASANNFLIKGDIPILLSKDSADVWEKRELFFLDLSAGAPPDFYNQEGQSWGFPVYNWEEMEKQGYCWWKQRLEVAENFYHTYRIDHIVGFFRIWTIPPGKTAKEGKFFPEEESIWIAHGKKIMLMMLDSSLMLPIGEDLGVVPNDVRSSLKELGICGTKVMRWERYWEEDQRFIPPDKYIPESLTTVSTHDADTLVLWWKDFPEEAKAYCLYKQWEYNTILSYEKLKDILKESHHTHSLFHINLLNEYLSLFPHLVHKNPEDERINIPGKILERNWSIRFVPSVEEITADKALHKAVRDVVK